MAQAYIRRLNQAKVYNTPIVTTLEPLEAFYPAEVYHQDYVRDHPAEPYVVYNAGPQVKKLRKTYPDKVKKDGG